MQAPANKLSIFIASSNEMEEERIRCKKIFDQLNDVYAQLYIKGFDWKYNMVHSNALGYANVQSAINNEHLKHAHLVIFIFYSKIGQHTREEFDYAVKNNKRIFIYFKDSFTPNKQTLPAFAELLDFKEMLDKPALYETYKELTDFEHMLYTNLNLYLSQTYLPIAAGANNQDIAVQLEQSEKSRKELEQQLATQAVNDALKAQALEEIKKGDYDAAEEHLMQSAEQDFEKVASTFYQLAEIKNLKLQYQDAYEFYKRALLLDPKNDIYLIAAGQMAETLGLYNESMVHLQKCLAISMEMYGKDSEEVGTVYGNIGALNWRLGNYDETIENCKTSLDIWQKLFKNEDLGVAISNSVIGLAYLEKEEYDKAIEKFQMALSIGEKILDEEHHNMAVWYNNLAGAYESKGEDDKAIQYYNKALAIDKKNYGEEHPSIATKYRNLGYTYDKKGEYDIAIQYYHQALTIDKKFYGEEHPTIAAHYNNIGGNHLNKGEYDEAIQYNQKALVINKKFYGEEHPSIATNYNNFGLAYYNKGAYNNAIENCEKALTILKKFFPPTHSYIQITSKTLNDAIDAKNKGVE